MNRAASRLVGLGEGIEPIERACEQITEELRGQMDLVFVFVSGLPVEQAELVLERVKERLPGLTLGCTAEGLMAGGREVEGLPAAVVWAAELPESRLLPFALTFHRSGSRIDCHGIPDIPAEWSQPTALVLADPFSSAMETAFDAWGQQRPTLRMIGGMASAARLPGGNRLLGSTGIVESGAVGVVIDLPTGVRSIVSQGCRPIGAPMIVTKVEKHLIAELGGRNALEVAQAMIADADDDTQRLAARGLHLGIVLNEYQEHFGRGDFLVANVLGVDPQSGALAVGTTVRVGQTVQFHVRDADSAHEDLSTLIAADRQQHPQPPAAALVFNCNGRGSNMFPVPNHDAELLQELYGPLPLAGFFAQGEIGPVAGRNFVHGFTASIALF